MHRASSSSSSSPFLTRWPAREDGSPYLGAAHGMAGEALAASAAHGPPHTPSPPRPQPQPPRCRPAGMPSSPCPLPPRRHPVRAAAQPARDRGTPPDAARLPHVRPFIPECLATGAPAPIAHLPRVSLPHTPCWDAHMHSSTAPKRAGPTALLATTRPPPGRLTLPARAFGPAALWPRTS